MLDHVTLLKVAQLFPCHSDIIPGPAWQQLTRHCRTSTLTPHSLTSFLIPFGFSVPATWLTCNSWNMLSNLFHRTFAHTTVPLPGILFPQVSSWLTPSVLSGLCVEVILPEGTFLTTSSHSVSFPSFCFSAYHLLPPELCVRVHARTSLTSPTRM